MTANKSNSVSEKDLKEEHQKKMAKKTKKKRETVDTTSTFKKEDVIENQSQDMVLSSPPEPMILLEESGVVETAKKIEKTAYKTTIKFPKKPVTTSILDDKIIDSTKQTASKTNNGLIAYSVPEVMQVGKDYDVKARISKDTSNNEKNNLIIGDKNIPINSSEKSVITIESIRVSSVMSAALTSEPDDFKITALSTEVQDIEKTGYTEWEWTVMPLQSGENPLKMIVKVRIKTDGDEVFKDIVVFEKNLKVQANWFYSIQQFIINFWQWILSSVIFPILIWLYKRKKKEDKEA